MNRDFNIQLWHNKRELEFAPPHFIKCHTKVTDEAMLWVISSLEGRYSLVNTTDFTDFDLTMDTTIYFENPSEAMVYELRWSGGK